MLKYVKSLLGIKWTLRAGEHLSKNKSFVIVANHQSCLDVMGIIGYTQILLLI